MGGVRVSGSMCLVVCDSVSIASTDADTVAADMMELSPSHLAPASVPSSSSVAVVKPCVSNLSLMFAAADSHDDSVDRAWREHVNEVLSTSSAAAAAEARAVLSTSSATAAEARAVRTFHLFPRLFYVRISSLWSYLTLIDYLLLVAFSKGMRAVKLCSNIIVSSC